MTRCHVVVSQIWVPKGATEGSVSLTVTMRDFDINSDNHPFSESAQAGRPASQLIEITSSPPVAAFQIPIIVRISHQIADLAQSDLSVVLAQVAILRTHAKISRCRF